MDLVRKSARGKKPVLHKNNNKGAELAGEMLAGSAFSVYANNEPKPALARDLGDCRDNKGKLAKRVFTCCMRCILYTKFDTIPISQSDRSDRPETPTL